MENTARLFNTDSGGPQKETNSLDESGSSASSVPRKRARIGLQQAKNKQDEGNVSSRNRRPRRTFSCDSCRKAKCRCEYDSVTQTCHRCRTLRLACSLSVGCSLPDSHLSQPGQLVLDEGPKIELRVRHLEEVLVEIRSELHALRSTQPSNPVVKRISVPSHEMARSGIKSLNDTSKESASISETTRPKHSLGTADSGLNYSPADEHIGFSPAVVIRQIDSQLTGYRRMFETARLDLVHLQIVSEQTADELIALFIRHRRHTFPYRDASDLVGGGSLRHVSPFLHAVCCVNGFRFSRGKLAQSPLHRKVYEHVRYALGHVLLASPLPHAELLGVLIMCVFSPAPTQGPEYIDSWVLSGHCAQHAMLTINFSNIIDQIKLGQSTPTDQQAIRLWANTCLCHLQWAAVTGRPPMIPSRYIRQCNILLDFYEATILDSALIAELWLYSTFHQRVSQCVHLQKDGECGEIDEWKQKWAHVFELSISSRLKISYHVVYLMLARRSLEDIRKQSRKEPSGIASRSTNDVEHMLNRTNGKETLPGVQTGLSDSTDSDVDLKTLQEMVSRFAILMVQAFVEMSFALSQELPELYYLCISYAVLVVAQYDHYLDFSEKDILELIRALRARCPHNEGTRTVMMFAADRAIEKFESRFGPPRQSSSSLHQRALGTEELPPIEARGIESLPIGDFGAESSGQHGEFDGGYMSYEGLEAFWDGFPGLTGIDCDGVQLGL